VFPGATLDGVRRHLNARTTLDIRTLAARIEARRAELHLEQTEVAEKAGLSRAYISRLEGALVANPKLFDLDRVAVALETTLAVLLAPEPSVTMVRLSHDWDDLQRQVAALDVPDEIREQILRSWRESIGIMHATANLARRN
jgi:transcriptional regulator with XRE-family HTH domain